MSTILQQEITILDFPPPFIFNYYFYTCADKFCDCGGKNIQVYGWGAYVSRRFHRIKKFCGKCYENNVKKHLMIAFEKNHCEINIAGLNGERLPTFLLELQYVLRGNNQQFLPI